MKAKYTNVDISALLSELNHKLRGLRVNQVYDVDHRTYLIRFNTSAAGAAEDMESANKIILLLESGSRFHTTSFQWPKSVTPSSFTMKLRKHLNNKRLEHIQQVGVDRIVDFQFGSGEAAYHIILELYDRGNIVITDSEWVILNILRPRTESGEDSNVRFAVREKYPKHLAKTADDYKIPSQEEITGMISAAKPADPLKKIFVPKLIFGPALLEHCFMEVGLEENAKIRSLDPQTGPQILTQAFQKADQLFRTISANKSNPGFVTMIEERKVMKGFDPKTGSEEKELIDTEFRDFHPYLFSQIREFADEVPQANGKQRLLKNFDSFDEALDYFFSSIKGQKLESRQRQLEKEALMKLERVRLDHEKRLNELSENQERDEKRADLIIVNADLVEEALTVIRDALRQKLPWPEIESMVKEKALESEAMSRIRSLNLAKNSFVMELSDPFESDSTKTKELLTIDIDLSSFANARRFHDKRKVAATKEDKTIKSSEKALKSAQIKTQTALKEVAIKTSIQKSRKVYWFEKFYWCISSENYLMIAGRDAQQNELVVKRHMKPGDVYVHGDLHGAASVVVVNNDPRQEIPPRTLEEAATMAICHSSAWEAKIVARSWWVRPDQVSKTAPSGEYLSVGAFMIRGKKNYLPLTQLILGFGFLFKLDEESTARHRGERSGKSMPQFEPEAEVEVPIDDQDDGDESGRDENDEPEFPDTKVRTMSIASDGNLIEDEVTMVASAEPRVKRQVMRLTRKNVKNATQKTGNENHQTDQNHQAPESVVNGGELSRTQRAKLKKIKKKYKDQDEEDRMIRMAILGKTPSGQPLDSKKKNRRANKVQNLTETVRSLQTKVNAGDEDPDHESVTACDEDKESAAERDEQVGDDVPVPVSKELTTAVDQVVDDEDDDDPIEEDAPDSDDSEAGKSSSSDTVPPHVRLLDSLTGQPTSEDNLLFCIPVVGPYSSMTNYKFKVKVIPGSNRRGKAAKTALHLFTMDRNISRREKDLLKNAKDMDVSKNLPAKIKITTSVSAVKKH
jgi:predicted ribosome quality control (RQC) complex YloA/Tae2 family protein